MTLSLLSENLVYMCDSTVCVGVSVSLQPAVCTGSDCGLTTVADVNEARRGLAVAAPASSKLHTSR